MFTNDYQTGPDNDDSFFIDKNLNENEIPFLINTLKCQNARLYNSKIAILESYALRRFFFWFCFS